MPQETNSNSLFTSPSKNLRGLKALVSNNEAPFAFTEEIINDYELAQRKAEEAGTTSTTATTISILENKGPYIHPFN